MEYAHFRENKQATKEIGAESVMEEGMGKGSRCRRAGNYSCKVIVTSESTEEILYRDG